jgi:hypothetical protein
MLLMVVGCGKDPQRAPSPVEGRRDGGVGSATGTATGIAEVAGDGSALGSNDGGSGSDVEDKNRVVLNMFTASDRDCESGDGLCANEINRVIKARASVFNACYQRELKRSPGLAGKIVAHFTIGGDGVVKSAKVAAGSSLRNDAVESCVTSNIMRLKFPAKGGLANVNYPFLFQPGG